MSKKGQFNKAVTMALAASMITTSVPMQAFAAEGNTTDDLYRDADTPVGSRTEETQEKLLDSIDDYEEELTQEYDAYPEMDAVEEDPVIEVSSSEAEDGEVSTYAVTDHEIHIDIDMSREQDPWHVKHTCDAGPNIGESDIEQTDFVKADDQNEGHLAYRCAKCGRTAEINIPPLPASAFTPTAETQRMIDEGIIYDGKPVTIAYDIDPSFEKWIGDLRMENTFEKMNAARYNLTIKYTATFHEVDNLQTGRKLLVSPRPVTLNHNFVSKYFDNTSAFTNKEVYYEDIDGHRVIVPHKIYNVKKGVDGVDYDVDSPAANGSVAGMYAAVAKIEDTNYIWDLGNKQTGRTVQLTFSVWPTAEAVMVNAPEDSIKLKGIYGSDYQYVIVPGISGFDSSRPGETRTTVQVMNNSGIVDTIELPVFVVGVPTISNFTKEYDGKSTPLSVPETIEGVNSYDIVYQGTTTAGEQYNSTTAPVNAGTYKATITFVTKPGVGALDPITVDYVISKATQVAPVPTLASSTTSSITVVEVPNAEYSIDNHVWQDTTTFGNLEADHEYTIYLRLKGDYNHEVSDVTSATFRTGQTSTEAPTLDKQTYTYSGNPIAYQVPSVSHVKKVTVTYSMPDGHETEVAPIDAGTYPVKVSFEMQPGAAPIGDINTTLEILKANQDPPTAPKANTVGVDTIILAPVNGAEFSIDNGSSWTISNVFEGLTPDTDYTVLAKYPADKNHNESATSSSVIRTSKQSSSAGVVQSAVFIYDGTPKRLVADAPIGCKEVVQTFSGINNTVYGPTTDAPVNPGEYKVKVEYVMEDGYEELPAQYANLTIRKGEQEAPPAPEVLNFTDTTITIKVEPGCAYSIDGGNNWQTTGEFKGLTRNTAYTIQVKKLATQDLEEVMGPSTVQTTDKTVVSFPKLIDQTVEYTGHPITYTLPKYIQGIASMQIEGYNGKPVAPTEAGEYTVSILFTPADGYKLPDVVPTPKLIIALNSVPVNPTLRNETVVYTGAPLHYHGAEDIPGTTGANILYSGIGSTVYDETDVAPTNAGTYMVEAIFIPDGGHTIAPGPFTANFTILKADQDAPLNADVQETTSTSITITDIPGAEYSIDGGKTWQESNIFEGLNLNTRYTVLVRMAADENHNASATKAVVASTTKHVIVVDDMPDFNTVYNGNGQPYPNTSMVSSKEGVKSVDVMYFGTLANGDRYESSVAPVNAGEYTVRFYIVPETNYEVGEEIINANMVIEKAPQVMNDAPTIAKRTTTTITLNPVAGAEYSIDNGQSWQTSNRFTGLTPNTEYTFMQRLAETDNYFASDSKTVTGKTFEDTGLTYTIDYPNEVIHFDVNVVDGSRDYTMLEDLTDGDPISPKETIYVRLIDDGSGQAGPIQMEVLPDRPKTPEIKINPYDFKMNSTDAMEYSVDGGHTWNDCSNQQVTEDLQGQTLQVRIKATEDSFKSLPCEVTVPVRAEAPELHIDNDKEIMDNTSSMEYSVDNGVSWIPMVDNMSMSDMVGETLWVRVSCDGVNPASNYAEITVPERNEVPTTSIDTAKETLAATGTKPQWFFNDGWVDIDGGTLDLSDKCGQTIVIRECFDEDNFASVPVEINVPLRGATPDLTVDRLNKTTNTTDTMEYSVDGGQTWEPTGQNMDLSDLAGQTIIVREKATGTTFASDSVELVVPNYAAEPDVSIDMKKETINTTEDMDYSLDGGNTWQQAPNDMNVSDLVGQDILIRNNGNDDEFPSEGVKLEIPARRDEPEVEINNRNETVAPTAGTEFSTDGGLTWTESSDPLNVSDHLGETILVRYPATDSEFASSVTTVVLPERPDAPVIIVNPKDQTMNTTEDMEVSTDGGETWIPAEDNMDISDWAGQDILVRYPATDDSPASSSTTVTIFDKQEQPSSKLDKDNCVITPTEGTEFSTDGGVTWNPTPSPLPVDGLEGDSILVRNPADDTHLPSDPVQIDVPERREEPNVSIDFKKETLNTDSTMEYSTDGGKTWVDANANMGTANVMGQTILVRNGADDDHLPSNAVEVTIPTRGAAPVVGHQDESRGGRNDGALTKTDSTMEYREVGGEWKQISGDKVTGLKPGKYEVRYSATDSSFSSESQIVTIAKGKSSTGGGGGGGGSSDPKYDVDFRPNGGSDVKDQTVRKGNTVSEPKDPVKEGYIFDGWYTDKDCTEKYDFDDKVKKDLVLYAKWVKDDSPIVIEKPEDAVMSGAEMLNMEDHIAYISGRTATKMAPNAKITRGEVAAMLYRLLSEKALDAYGSSANVYRDVMPGSWYANAIATLSNAGIISGYGNGVFGPDRPITRAELASMLVRFSDVKVDGGTDTFNDIAGHWARTSINKAAKAGIVSGYANGQFKPNNNVTRAETVAMINRLLGRHCDADGVVEGIKVFDDVKQGDWFYWDIVEAANGHDYTTDIGGETWTKLK